ncbi:VOC family protein [Humidisolicoccus flavus]|uniref:VOC family protein n=1 Tax=Humidisolicoccus flavus TaxID=3111414 RepID=UPI003244B18E
MANSVAAVWVPVSDMERAIRFYREVLGLDIEQQDTNWSEATIKGGLTIGLNGHETAKQNTDGGGAVITFYPEGSIEDERDRLVSQGVEITDEIGDYPWGRFLPFKDSEGNDLQLFVSNS